MGFRLRVFSIHLLASSVILSFVMASFYFGWYSWPAWYLEGTEKIIGLMVIVDLVVGPLATLLVSNPNKERYLLRLDWGVIVVLQITALAYGSLTLWQGRPLFYAFSVNQMELVTASQFDAESLRIAREKSASIIPSWSSLPKWIWAPLPDDPKEAEKIVLSAILEGKDVTGMPQHFFPWLDGLNDLQSKLHSIPELRERLKLDDAAHANLLHKLGQDEATVGWLLIQGGKREGVMIFERASGKPVEFLSVPL